MRHGIFVTGTDTNVGKTGVAAALMLRYRGHLPLRYWKPIQTGIEQDDDTAEVMRLARVSIEAVLEDGVRLPRPVSPHLAARLSGRTIEIQPLVESIASAPESTRWIVEGAGGALAPINESAFVADLMMQLGFPVVVVSRSGLGTINHTLLTLEALRCRSLIVAGVVMVGDRDVENRQAIERYGKVDVLGEMPWFDSLTPDALSAWAASELDPASRLLGRLR